MSAWHWKWEATVAMELGIGATVSIVRADLEGEWAGGWVGGWEGVREGGRGPSLRG